MTTERTRLEYDLDHEWRWAVRERDGWKCQGRTMYCKTEGRVFIPPTKALHASHFFGRRHRGTRWDLDNGDSQCATCHRWFGENPHDHTAWKQAQMSCSPYLDYDALVLRAHTTKKWALGELEDLLESLQQYRDGLDRANQLRKAATV